jgi:hypothetical protein
VTTNERTFVLRTAGAADGYAKYYTGQTPDGRKVLARYGYEAIEVVWFDPDGNLLRVEVVPAPEVEPREGELGFLRESRSVRLWEQGVGFHPGPIEVRPFALDDPFPIGVHILPGGCLEFLRDPYCRPTPEEREEMAQATAEWLAKGNYVLVWAGEEFGLTRDGEQAD